MKAGILWLVPVLKPVIWGGTRLQEGYGKVASATVKIGESWEISGVADSECRVASSGLSLAVAYERDARHFCGVDAAPPNFPLLVKLLCTTDWLSLQVHPSDEQAARRVPSTVGKREAWLILEASGSAEMFVGLKPGVSAAEFRAILETKDDDRLKELLRRVKVRPGDVFDIPPGTVHAIGPGIVLVEVQQPVDCTYRFSDWGRFGSDGMPRKLHVDDGLAVLDAESRPERLRTAVLPLPRGISGTGAFVRELLLDHAKFRWERWSVDGEVLLENDGLLCVTCVDGKGSITDASVDSPGLPIGQGASCVVPSGVGKIRVEGRALVLSVAKPKFG